MNSKLTISASSKLLIRKNFVNWEIEFTKDSNDKERVNALSKVEKYLIDSLHKMDGIKSLGILQAINFSVIPNLGNRRFDIRLSFGIKSTGETLAPIVPPTPPKFVTRISPFIKSIKVLREQTR